MLAIGDWYIDLKTHEIFKKIDDNQPLDLSKKEVELLIILANNQHCLTCETQIVEQLWPDDDTAAKSDTLRQLVDSINQTLKPGVINITDQQNYLLTLPTFGYDYTPITPAQMKQKLAEKQLKAFKSKQQMQQSKQKQQQNEPKQASTGQKILYVAIVAALIVGFLAAS